MTTPTPLPTNIDATFADSGPDASVKAHQQQHDRLHRLANTNWINVKDYGAVGDGAVNDGPAIQAALDAVDPAVGGVVWFPPEGVYLTNQPLVPKAHTMLAGGHTPRYHVTVNPQGASKVRVGPGWTGTAGQGLIHCNGTNGGGIKGVTLSRVALVGNGQAASDGGPVHGIRMPDSANTSGEQGWTLENVTVAGFTGSGIFGRIWVWIITNCRFVMNTRYGIETATGTADRWNDAKVLNTYFYYNRMGGVFYDGGTTALVFFTGCRFERSGQTFMNPSNSPVDPLWNADAAGVRLKRAAAMNFTSCSTDANTGPGFDVWSSTTALDSPLKRITFVACFANRDGGGAQGTTNPADISAGFRVTSDSATDGNVSRSVHFVGCETSTGPSNDDGDATKLISPAFGVRLNNSFFCDWLLGEPQGVTGSFQYAGDLFGLSVVINDDAQGGILRHRNRFGVQADISTGYGSLTTWRSDVITPTAGVGTSTGTTTTLAEVDASTTGTRHILNAEETGVRYQLHVNANVTTAVADSTITISLRDVSNTANVLATVTFPTTATGPQVVKSGWVTRPVWFTGDKTIAAYHRSNTGTPVIILKDATVRWKTGGA